MLMEIMEIWSFLDADQLTEAAKAAGKLTSKPTTEGQNTDLAFTAEEIELLAEMEQYRWNAERYLSGWVYGEKKSIPLKISPYIVPWEELMENIKEYDRDTIRNIPAILAEIGERVERM